MRVNYYKCTCCGVQKHAKARMGSRDFESSSFLVQAYQNVMLGRIEDDPGRPASTPDNIIGRHVQDGDEDHNFTMFRNDGYYSDGPTFPIAENKRQPVKARLEPAKDFVIRVSMSEDEPDIKKEARARLTQLAKVLSDRFEEKPGIMAGDPPRMVNAAGLTSEERDQLMCYLVGGHDFKFIGYKEPGEEFVEVSE